MTAFDTGYGVRLSGFGTINLPLTLDCGQAFRWKNITDGAWQGATGNHTAKIIQDGGDLIFLGESLDGTFDAGIWADYFDFDTDYDHILRTFRSDPVLKNAVEQYGCIRI